MTILVTGAAGFIGAAVAEALACRGDDVVGVDSLNDYYDVSLKEARIARVQRRADEVPGTFTFLQGDVADRGAIEEIFSRQKFSGVIHLAAQAGVRYSLENPRAYIDANIVGFMNILEACRHNAVTHLVYASSSSVYGANERMPFSVSDNVDHPVSLYAATKKANELMAHTYSYLYQLPTTGLRFFTVYGPWGRPDMSPFIFARKILAGEPLDVFNYGNHRRDFTYIDDIVEGVIRVLDQPAAGNVDWDGMTPDPSTSRAPWRVFNIGCQTPVPLMDFIETIERRIGRTVEKRLLPMQPGDVEATFADVSSLATAVGYKPSTPLREGIGKFVDWYLEFYGNE